MAVMSAQLLRNDGWGLFVALPFTMGFAAALIYGVRQPRSLGGCVGVACLSTALLGAALLGLAFEGMLCLLMALPIALPLAAFGGAFGYVVQRRRWLHSRTSAFLSALLIFVPGIQWMEHVAAPTPPVCMWFVPRSTSKPRPKRSGNEWFLFLKFLRLRSGCFEPVSLIPSALGSRAPGSTGAFVEPIEVWDEPRRLKFSVTSNPAPMEEWTPYSHVEPAHLHGFLVSNGGQFLLTPLPNGGTRLEGITWYRHSLWPTAYWRLWSDAIIHQIHSRVLRHIQEEAENQRQ